MPTIQQGHGRWAGVGRAGGRWASVRARRAGRARGWPCWALGRRDGRRWGAGAAGAGAPGQQARKASGRAERWRVRGRESSRHGRAGQAVAGARLGGRALGAGRRRAGLARQGQAACAALAGRARAWAHLVCWLGQLGARALDLIFKPVFRLGIFPESPNEHCSL